MSNAMDDLYDVQNGVNTVNAADHNTLVASSNFLYNNLGGFYNFQNGRDGHLYLGAVTATTSTAPTVALNGSGNLTAAAFYYKYSAYNLSGETAASSASSSIAVSGQQVKVTIPGTSNATNITGFYVYRSADNVTYYRIGYVTVDNPMNGAIFYDNFPITSGTAPSGSNTTSASATTDGFYYCRSFTMTSGQTLTVTNDTPTGLFICSQGNISIASGATISGTGKTIRAKNTLTGFYLASQNAEISSPSPHGVSGNDSSTPARAVFPDSDAVRAMLLQKWNAAGTGGDSSTGVRANAGACVMLISSTQITLAGTVTLTGGAGANTVQGGGGGAGGTLALVAPYINRSGATITSNGGAGGSSSDSNYASGGGGGGAVIFISDYLTGTATVTVNAGAAGSKTGTSTNGIGYGGANGGDGGARNSAGSVGLIATATINQVAMF